MDEHKICFIMCTNDRVQARECQLYIEQLIVPRGYQTEVLTVEGAKSMASGYNEAMRTTDAKYKVYLHQDVLILNLDFLQEILSLFQKHQEIGMLGMVGNESIAADGGMWSDGSWRRTGQILGDFIYANACYALAEPEGDYAEVITLDGLMMVTQYDLPWREDLFKAWDFYDASQSVEFWKAGYKVVVPHMEAPWVLHENDVPDMLQYDQWKEVFVAEYEDYYKEWMKQHPSKLRRPEEFR